MLQSVDGKVPFKYAGKPAKALLQHVRRNYLGKGGRFDYLNVYEFDQNGLVFLLRGCAIQDAATFWPTYFPCDINILHELGRAASLYLMLAREPLDLNGHKMYWPCVFDGTEFAGVMKIVAADCARGKIRGEWFKAAQVDACIQFLQQTAQKWVGTKPPQAKPTWDQIKAKLKPTDYGPPQWGGPIPKVKQPLPVEMPALPEPPRVRFEVGEPDPAPFELMEAQLNKLVNHEIGKMMEPGFNRFAQQQGAANMQQVAFAQAAQGQDQQVVRQWLGNI